MDKREEAIKLLEASKIAGTVIPGGEITCVSRAVRLLEEWREDERRKHFDEYLRTSEDYDDQ